MSRNIWRHRVVVGVSLFAGLVVFNFLVCHPVDFVRTNDRPSDWTTYQNPKYGYGLDIPTNWSIKESAFGMELYQPESGRFISVKALAEESSLLAIPIDEYALERAPIRHPYLANMALPEGVASEHGIRGYRTRSNFRTDVDWSTIHETWVGKNKSREATIVYMPTQFQGDVHCVVVEILTVGKPDPIYERMVRSFNHVYKTLRQNELMAMGLIDTSETPSPAVAYVGETRGFYHDFDHDGQMELLIAGMPRNMEDTKERCFFRVLKKTGTYWVRMIEEKFSENSFHSSDIKMVNVDNQFGQDVFLRFVEHGNPWGKNTTVVVLWDGKKYRSAHFGAFGDARDLDGDGRDEVIYTTNSYFSQGAIASWYDVYVYEGGDFKEANTRYQKFYQNEVLPGYKEQLETVQGELALTSIAKFRDPAYQLVFRLKRYIDWSAELAQGRPILNR